MRKNIIRTSKLLRLRNLAMTIIVILGFFLIQGCTPEPCEDCYKYTYSDGTSEWICVEYDCSDF